MTEAQIGAAGQQEHDTPLLLETRNLEKIFVSGWLNNRKTVRAVDGVDLQLQAGQAIGLVGESGSGKSTVARLIARLVRPTSGQILLNGRDVTAEEPRHASRAYRHDMQMIFQDPFSSLNPVHTIGYHLNRSLQIHRTTGNRPPSEAIADLLEDVGLSSVSGIVARYPHELSGGQRQRAAIARTLAARPALLVADEPTSMLDVSVRVGILNLLDDLRQDRNIGLLLITHDLASARYATSHTLVMYAGRILEFGPSADIIASPQHPYTRLLVGSIPRRTVIQAVATQVSQPRTAVRSGHAGCPFAARCPSRLPVCESTMPGPEYLEASRWVKCHLYGPGDQLPGPTFRSGPGRQLESP
jgi:peptide/nickel transport system ATP-binding protein